MRKRWIAFIALLCLVVVLSYAAGRLIAAGKLIELNEPGIMRVQDYLGLSAEQRKAVYAATVELVKARQELRQRVWAARDHFVDLIRDPNASQSDILAALRDLSRAREEMSINTVSYLLELRAHLTPAQRAKLTTLIEQGMCSLTGSSGACGPPGGRACGLGILGPSGGRDVPKNSRR
jgi:Spy/CpxP family protein refolding chaperone